MTEVTVGKEKLHVPDSKVHGANTGPTGGPRWAPCWPHKPCYLGWCHHTVTSGTAYLQVAVVISLSESSQDTVSRMGKIYSGRQINCKSVHYPCVMSVMLRAREACATTVSDQNRLQRHEWAMIRRMCEVTTKDQVSSWRGCWVTIWQRYSHRLRWHDHIERSDVCLKKVQKHNPTGGSGRGRPKKTCQK